jgi:hypothetical protein
MKRYNKYEDDCLEHYTIFDKIVLRLKNIKMYYCYNSFNNKMNYKFNYNIRKNIYYTSDIDFKESADCFGHTYIGKDIKIFIKNKYIIKTYLICG